MFHAILLRKLQSNIKNFNLQRNIHAQKLRRALLYVPGDDERKLNKILNLKVDSVILDCEDGVAFNRKNEARTTITSFIQKKLIKNSDCGARINPVESDFFVDDINVILSAKETPDTIYLPKLNTINELNYFNDNLKKYYKKTKKIDLIFYAENCLGIIDLPDICRKAIELSQNSPFRLAGIVFGSDDLCASLGASRTRTSDEVLYARQRVVLIAKAFNLEAIDMVHIDLEDTDSLIINCQQGASFGYTGKQVIHPSQIEIVQQAFLPSLDKAQWAEELLTAFKEFQKSGKGAFVFRKQMIDAPTMKQAQNIVDIIRAAKA